MNFPESPEYYWNRLARLPERIHAALAELPEKGPYEPAQVELARQVAAELDELLHWQVFNDSFSRDSYWLFLNHLSLKTDQARFAAIAFQIDAALQKGALAEAFAAYCQQVQRRRRSDPWLVAWLNKSDEHPVAE